MAEKALNAVLNYHLGNETEAENNRNGYGRQTVSTGQGKIDIEVPPDRTGSFDPQLIAKYQRRFSYACRRLRGSMTRLSPCTRRV